MNSDGFERLDGGKGVMVSGNGVELSVSCGEKMGVFFDLGISWDRSDIKKISGMNGQIEMDRLNQKNCPVDNTGVEVGVKIGEVENRQSIESGVKPRNLNDWGFEVDLAGVSKTG